MGVLGDRRRRSNRVEYGGPFFSLDKNNSWREI